MCLFACFGISFFLLLSPPRHTHTTALSDDDRYRNFAGWFDPTASCGIRTIKLKTDFCDYRLYIGLESAARSGCLGLFTHVMPKPIPQYLLTYRPLLRSATELQYRNRGSSRRRLLHYECPAM